MPFAVSPYVTWSRKITSLPKLSTVPFGVLSWIPERTANSVPFLLDMMGSDGWRETVGWYFSGIAGWQEGLESGRPRCGCARDGDGCRDKGVTQKGKLKKTPVSRRKALGRVDDARKCMSHIRESEKKKFPM